MHPRLPVVQARCSRLSHPATISTASAALGLAVLCSALAAAEPNPAAPLPRDTIIPPPRAIDGSLVTLRLATFNVHDLRTEQLLDEKDETIARLTEVIAAIRPNILLLNEIAYDHADRAGGRPEEGQNGARFADRLRGLADDRGGPLDYEALMLPSNTGVSSGHDLDNDGVTETKPGSRAYAGDCLGYGEFPGHYAMALLVSKDFQILRDQVRTFREFRWRDMPGARLPPAKGAVQPAADGSGWYSAEELAVFPLSSKSHWDVPVRLKNGTVIHCLCSHPTPPVFDGDEDRNGRRNHDEIEFWLHYINGAEWIRDDDGGKGGLPKGASFVVMGDLNADPGRINDAEHAITRLLHHPRLNAAPTPTSRVPVERHKPEHTAGFRLRVDYVLPSNDLHVTSHGVWRGPADSPPDLLKSGAALEPMAEYPSDHYPVWVEIQAVAPGATQRK